MSDNFDRCVAFVLKQEGGYVNDIRDGGGETNYGISKRAYPSLDIKNLTRDEAIEIYRSDYWQRAGCDALEWPMCLVVFDTAVNMGVGRAQEFNVRAINWSDYLFMRIQYYIDLNQSAFLRGWITRVIDLWREAKAEPVSACLKLGTDEHPVSM